MDTTKQSINDKPVLTKDELKYKKEIQRMENEGGYVPPAPALNFRDKLNYVMQKLINFIKKLFSNPSQPPQNPSI